MIKGQRYFIHGKTIADVQKQVTELKYRLEHGLFVAKQNITLAEWFDTWMEQYKKNRIKIGTYTSYRKYFDCAIKERLGSRKIADIRGEHIQKLYNELAQEDYALSSIKVVSAVLNGCMQQALFVEYAKDSYLYNLFAVMLRTGMRSGEIRGLKYTDIDRKKNVIHVQRTLKYIEGQGYLEDTPKTRTSKRDIPLTKDILELLEAQKRYWGFKVTRLDSYLFCNENGEPLSRDRVQAEIERIIKQIHAAGHEFERITPHVFRHTFATRAIEAGMQPQVLKTILGHSSLAMTMDLYSHVLPDTKADEMEKIANVF
ncbi:site-specific recombinase, phage integrase family [Marvinbryantia formatexigens DSM 14469]|uniref:Site-specific recombinase, phage integrase family n=1 Tax=Marvinbryantia formatexigens DSM 14469 TaxID=478749 RepID=C6LMN6_9FIRM|nr:site-specific integrase [Marvinbryantia formatexigens]EET58118.1 site-specific recombinase, phage integrase family [Marvinbryantia formatexigens DSM 14469]UWO25651.1 site-specific integrase [Marvinbryantia formatexigens DSM 14469]SDH40279.1 Phage integrase, N-terminal SAM-like domain [Marvinbryantia formatexigens]